MDLVAQVEALNRIGIALSSETNLQKLMELILDEGRRLTGADGGSLYLKEKNNLTFYVTQNNTLNDRSNFGGGFKHHKLPISKESFAGFVAVTGKVLSIDDAYNLPKSAPYRFNYDFDRENDYRTSSVLVVPMKTPDGDVVGVLQLINAMDKTGNVRSFPEDVQPLASSLASQAAVALRNARLIHDIKNLLRSIIQFSASAIDARSPHTAGHSWRVAEYSKAIAMAINRAGDGFFESVNFSPDELEELYYSAWLHDIGKIGIPEAVLDKEHKLSDALLSAINFRFELIKALKIVRKGAAEQVADVQKMQEVNEADIAELDGLLNFIKKVNTSNQLAGDQIDRLAAIAGRTFTMLDGSSAPYLTRDEFLALAVPKGNLTDEEYKKIQSHVIHTKQIIDKIPFPEYLNSVPRYASTHHEMLDGSGYPNGLKGDALPLQARILAVVDIFDALTAVDRPYRKSMPLEQALTFLTDEVGRGRLDRDVVDIFISNRLYEAVSKEEQVSYFAPGPVREGFLEG